jgi:riboflavin synthase
MFTGLVQSIGKIKAVGQDSWRVSYPETSALGHGLELGDSVAVDGICLTVEEITAQGFLASVSPETLQRTTLASLQTKIVNLETSLRVGSKLGGHFVTGHIDGVGSLTVSVVNANSWEMRFAAPRGLEPEWQEAIAPYLIPKGSVAVNGVSLTVAACDPEGSWFQVAVIPHSFSQTNLATLKVGDRVNIEADILGKYVEKLINHPRLSRNHRENITPDFLAEHGYV